jgi:formylglycine-generating enzyme required for sulfatase activity
VAASCTATRQPLGEAVIVVQTDVAVPNRIGRLRVDVLDAAQALVQTREVVTPTAEDWPVSFSVTLPDDRAEADMLVRLRGYPEGHVISARDLERFARQPARNVTVASSIDALCANPPVLVFGQPLTLRRGGKAITTVLSSNRNGVTDCTKETHAGSVAAQIQVKEADSYQIEIVGSVPDGARGEPGGDTTLSLRTSCLYPTTQIACNDDIVPLTNRLSRLVIDLQPGTYFVLTGGETAAPADLTLLASRVNAFQQVPPSPPPLSADPAELDPEPGVVIDRLVAIHLRPGERGDVPITLHGECFGTPADLVGRQTCLDTAGARQPVTTETPRGSLTHDVPRAAPSWAGDDRPGCTTTPRPASPLLDGEACIPGGAFLLGDTLALVDLDRRAQPERMRVVEPLLLDVYEMTVGRYRDAVKRGFHSPDDTPSAFNQPKLDPTQRDHTCTWNTAGDTSSDPLLGADRESFPLNCVSWSAARALCQFLGGDLPTEDQWEFASTAAAPGAETPYPWGKDLPTCTRTVFARSTPPLDQCASAGLGPLRANDPLLVAGDVSVNGVVGLGGNVQEWLATAFVPYADPAWEKAGLRGRLDEEDAPLRVVRGADWTGFSLFATGSARRAQPAAGTYDAVGFRCARPGR